jgi:hypothetical protein
MGFLIQDGTGTGFHAKVTSENRVRTDGVSEGPLEAASDRGDAAIFFSSYSATGGDEIISIKNGEPLKNLHITRILATATGEAIFTLFEVTSGTAAGTTLTYQNPNLDSGVTNSGTFFGNASVTGSLSGNTLAVFAVSGASVETEVFLEGSLQLANGDEIAITCDGSVTPYITMLGFWKDNTEQ